MFGPVTKPTARAVASCGVARGCPGGGASCRVVGRLGSGALPPPTARPLGVRPGPATHSLWVRGALAWAPVTYPTARALANCLCALWGRHAVAWGGGFLPLCGAPGVGHSPSPDRPSFKRAAGARYPLAVGAGDVGVDTRHLPHSARSCELALRAVGAARRHLAGVPLALGVGHPELSALPRPTARAEGVRTGPATQRLWVRCAGVGARFSLAPSPVPRFVVCCARFPGLRHPVAIVAWHLSLCRGCGRLRASLACLVAPHWCAAPRPLRLLSVLRLAFWLPWCLPPPRGSWLPDFLGGCTGNLEAGREPGSLCLPLAPAEAGSLGSLRVAPLLGPRNGTVPGGSLRLRSPAACAAVVWCVCTRSLTCQVLRTVRISTADSAGAPGLFGVDADTSPFFEFKLLSQLPALMGDGALVHPGGLVAVYVIV